MEEIWKPVIDYQKYLVSNLGRVKNSVTNEVIRHQYDSNGYPMVRLYSAFGGKSIAVHLIVFYSFEFVPHGNKGVIDHKDNNPSNCKLSNLQLISRRTNASKDRKNKTSKYQGISFCKENNKWRAGITFNYKSYYLGYFDFEVDAKEIYRLAVENENLFDGNIKKFREMLSKM